MGEFSNAIIELSSGMGELFYSVGELFYLMGELSERCGEWFFRPFPLNEWMSPGGYGFIRGPGMAVGLFMLTTAMRLEPQPESIQRDAGIDQQKGSGRQ